MNYVLCKLLVEVSSAAVVVAHTSKVDIKSINTYNLRSTRVERTIHVLNVFLCI